jgi:hypothetical protein
MALRKYNLHEDKALFAQLTEAPIVKSRAAEHPGWTPKEKWSGAYAKYETLLTKFKAKPFPLPFGEKAAYEMLVANDYLHFFEDGEVYSTNNAQEMGYGVSKKYPGAITLYSKKGETAEGSPVAGYITLVNGKPTWNAVSSEESKQEESNPYLDGLQLTLDFAGLIPGFGDILDIINAGISFLRGNYFDGFLSLIGAIPVVGSAISIPLKAISKTFGRAGDVLKAAFKTRKSADELWMFIKSSGKLTRKELDMLVNGMGDVSDYITRFRKEADFVLPDAAAKSLDEFAGFLKKQSDGAAEVFGKAAKGSDEATRGILRVRKELNTIAGLKRLVGGGMLRRLRNLFSGALSPKELEALRGAMSMKFFRNIDSPGKLSILAKSTPELADQIGKNMGKYYNTAMQGISGSRKAFYDGWNVIKNTPGSASKRLEAQLDFLKKNAPSAYDDAKRDIFNAAAKGNNPMYKEFMNNEINGLGSYFSKDYADIISWDGIKARFSNLIPVIWNEIKDLGSDVLAEMGFESEDDVDALFWPLVKATVNTFDSGPESVVGTVKQGVSGGLKAAGETPFIGAGAEMLGTKVGAIKKPTYDPNVEFEIVPEKDPRLKQQQKQKQQRIQQTRRTL